MQDLSKIALAVLGILTITAAAIAIFGQVHTQKIVTNGPARSMGGTFKMGTSIKDIPALMEKYKVKRSELFEVETPQHRVKLSPFYLDRTEVTNSAFKRFIEANAEWRKKTIRPEFHNGKYLDDWNEDEFPEGKANFPVVFVSWYAAAAFCKAEGKRLPTEAEWEFAARGGLKGKEFPWGNEMPEKTKANFAASGLGGATSVASYLPNGFGLYDMAGNVWEFLADEWDRYRNTRETLVDPIAGSALFTGESFRQVRSRRVIRGGSYGGSPINLRITYRDSHSPENAVGHVGFRCANSAR